MRFLRRKEKKKAKAKGKATAAMMALFAEYLINGEDSLLGRLIPPVMEPWPVEVHNGRWTFRGTMHQPKGRRLYQLLRHDPEEWDSMTLELYDSTTKELVEEVPCLLIDDKDNLSAFFDLSKPCYVPFQEVIQ